MIQRLVAMKSDSVRSSVPKAAELSFLKRSDVVAEEIKLWVVERNLSPGERLPSERELMEILAVSKGTMREALKSLEVQGLIRIAMGPGGGAVLTKVTDERAMSLLAPYFYHREPTIADIYQVRILLEPEMAVSAVGLLTPEQMAELKHVVQRSLKLTDDQDIDDWQRRRRQRIDELRFHEIIAEACPNPWLAFTCKFMLKLLRDIVVVGRIYEIPLQEMSHSNQCSHNELLRAFHAGDRDSVGGIMERHMRETAEHMGHVQGQLDRRRFLRQS